MRIRNNTQDLKHKIFVAFILAFIIIGACVSGSLYMDAADGCNGVVVSDYMGLPVCVQNPSMAIPVGRGLR